MVVVCTATNAVTVAGSAGQRTASTGLLIGKQYKHATTQLRPVALYQLQVGVTATAD